MLRAHELPARPLLRRRRRGQRDLPAGRRRARTHIPGGGGAAYLAPATLTNGDYGLFRWDMAAAPSGPGPHFHRTMSEAFFVLSGTVLLQDGARTLEAGPGDFLYVPPGGIHGFRNESGSPASMLILFAPGAPRETYFEELAEIRRSGRTLTDAEWSEVYTRHDQYMV